MKDEKKEEKQPQVRRPGVGVNYEGTHVAKMQATAEASKNSSRLVGQSEPRF